MRYNYKGEARIVVIMSWILILVALLSVSGPLVVLAAKRKRRRADGNFQVVREESEITLGTLAANTAIEATGITLAMDCRWHSADILATLDELTSAEGPVMLGIAPANMTVTELKEALEASPTTKWDYPAVEHAKRPVRLLGQFQQGAAVSGLIFNNGNPKRVRLPISVLVSAGDKLPQVFAWNRSGAALTTGAVVRFQMKHYITWKV